MPYQVDGEATRPAPDSPALGAHTGTIEWPARDERAGRTHGLPLAGVRIVSVTDRPSAQHGVSSRRGTARGTLNYLSTVTVSP